MIRAIIFDYNQVLADDFSAHREAYKKAFNKYGIKLADDEITRILHMPRKYKIDYLKERHGLQEDNEHIFKEKEKEFFRIAKTRSLLFPETEEAIEKLSKKFALGIFTGTNLEQMLIPEKTMKLFKAIVTITDYEKPKPHPEGLFKCIERLKISANECAYVGDSPPDMEVAKTVGCKAIGKTTGIFSAEQLKEAGAEIIIRDLKELVEMGL